MQFANDAASGRVWMIHKPAKWCEEYGKYLLIILILTEPTTSEKTHLTPFGSETMCAASWKKNMMRWCRRCKQTALQIIPILREKEIKLKGIQLLFIQIANES